jgi:nucleotide-binding universal stress UspA family protein
VPLLLLPLHYREALPWTSMLVGASGDPASDHALHAAVRLGAALRLELSVVCCEDPATPAPALGRYADEAHHELPRRLEDLVRRSLPRSDDDPRSGIAHLLLRPGDAATQLSACLHQRGASVLALGWHGSLARGRARVLKRFLERAECPLLLVRDAGRPAMTLKVGERFEPPSPSVS